MNGIAFTLLIIALVIASGAYGVPLEQTQKCGANAAWVQCASSANNCANNCANHKNPPRACTLLCGSGCECNSGYVFRSGSSGDCVLPTSCN